MVQTFAQRVFARFGNDHVKFAGRVEDWRLIRGEGRYSNDIQLPDQAFGVFVRSAHASAHILSIDAGSAREAPGVLRVLTGEDPAIAALGNVSLPPPLVGREGKKLIVPHRPALAVSRVAHIGQPVALVVADTPGAAEDAAELVAIEYEPIPAVTDAEFALAPDAPQLWREAPGNLGIDWTAIAGPENDAQVLRILESAAHRVRIRAVNQRIAGVPLEPRAAVAQFDPESGRYTITCGSQGPTALKGQLAKILQVEPHFVRVQTGDVGGGFGLKTPAYPEYPALMVAARLVGRPVRWSSTRSEAFLSDNQGRDNVTTAELALDEGGRFLALKVDAVTNAGAFFSAAGAQIATFNFARCFPIVYHIPAIAVGVRLAFTNTVPTGPYRGAGRPEANYVMERLVEAAARQTGIDRVELRKRNLIAPARIPYSTAIGAVFDSGEFEPILDRALTLAGHGSIEARRAEAALRGARRGIGISCFLEHAGGNGTESADIAFTERGVILSLGVQSNGQGHATVFRDLLAEQLQLDPRCVTVQEGDSDLDLKGFASVGSRSTMTVGTATVKASEEVLEQARKLAADRLEAAEPDLQYEAGIFTIAGTDRSIGLLQLATEAAGMKARGEIEASLDTRATIDIPPSYPNGCHVAEVEIDPDTGHVAIVAYTAVDDCGNVLNHTLTDGQVVGALAQGLGQALMEQIVYDPESGQLIAGTFNDYAMPRAEQMPPVMAEDHPVPCRTNPLGVKGVGEAGTTGSIAAVMNAIADALPLGGADLQMPATPEKVWRACDAAARAGR